MGEDVAKIAERLTKTQKAALIRATPNYSGDAFVSTRIHPSDFSRLHDLHLIAIVMRGAMVTDIGRAVRAHLIAEGDRG